MNDKYIGWIPTAGCRLSFSVIGYTYYPKRAVTANVADSHTRAIICFQRRFLSDSAIPTEFLRRFVSESFFRLSSDFWFVCYANAGNNAQSINDPLKGTVLVFESKEYWKKSKKAVKKHIISLLDYKTDSEIPLTTFYNKKIEPEIDNNTYYALASADFEIARDGVCTLNLSVKKEIPEESIERMKTKSEIRSEEAIRHALSAQIFFFLKDISHIHQHHHPKTDTVVDLYKHTNSFDWMAYTLRALYRKVLDFKRNKEEGATESSKGMLAYISAFEKVCANRLKPIDLENLPQKENNLLQESISATKEKSDTKLAESTKRGESRKTTLFSIILALLAISGLARFLDPQPEFSHGGSWIRFISFLLIEKPLLSLIIILFLGLIIDQLFVHKIDFSIKKTKGLRALLASDLIRLTQGLTQKTAGAIYLLIGFSFLCLYVYYVINFLIFPRL